MTTTTKKKTDMVTTVDDNGWLEQTAQILLTWSGKVNACGVSDTHNVRVLVFCLLVCFLIFAFSMSINFVVRHEQNKHEGHINFAQNT